MVADKLRMSRYVFAAILPTLWILNRQYKRYITNVTIFCSNTISDNNSWALNIAYFGEVDLYRHPKFPGGDYTVTMGIFSLNSCSLHRLNGIDYKHCNFIGSHLSLRPSIKLIWLFSKVDPVFWIKPTFHLKIRIKVDIHHLSCCISSHYRSIRIKLDLKEADAQETGISRSSNVGRYVTNQTKISSQHCVRCEYWLVNI